MQIRHLRYINNEERRLATACTRSQRSPAKRIESIARDARIKSAEILASSISAETFEYDRGKHHHAQSMIAGTKLADCSRGRVVFAWTREMPDICRQTRSQRRTGWRPGAGVIRPKDAIISRCSRQTRNSSSSPAAHRCREGHLQKKPQDCSPLCCGEQDRFP